MHKPLAIMVTIPLVAAPLLVSVPAGALSTVKQGKLERNIRQGFQQRAGIAVTVTCPAKITWVKGKTFFCRAQSAQGDKYRVQVRLGNEAAGKLRWKVVS